MPVNGSRMVIFREDHMAIFDNYNNGFLNNYEKNLKIEKKTYRYFIQFHYRLMVHQKSLN
jgi:hypothetical protein